jgi:crossover junction endodeoxyribonuclease RusA
MVVISEAGRKYRKAVGEQVFLQSRGKSTVGPVKVVIEAYRPDNRRRDLDNLLKAVLDSLGHAGIYIDDSLIVDLRIYWAESIGGMLKIKVEELDGQKRSVGN